MPTKAYAAASAHSPLAPFTIDRREPGPHDVHIEIAYLRHLPLRHSPGPGRVGQRPSFPWCPGTRSSAAWSRSAREVKRFAVGDLAGVGCMVDSCRTCAPCRKDLEQFCEKGAAFTYNGTEMDRKTPTYGGYSTRRRRGRALRAEDLRPALDLAGAAPLLCAGITTYSPLRHWKVKPGDRVGVVGLGGLGHMAVKLAAAMGAEVTCSAPRASKEADARRLGAHHVRAHLRRGHLPASWPGASTSIIDTISAPHDYNSVPGHCSPSTGRWCSWACRPSPPRSTPSPLIGGRRSLAGSLIGGIAETQEMLDFCAEHGNHLRRRGDPDGRR